jgi:hypothetical protein
MKISMVAWSILSLWIRARQAYLQGQLPTIEHGTLEWIGFLLQICFCSLTRRKQIFKDCWQ